MKTINQSISKYNKSNIDHKIKSAYLTALKNDTFNRLCKKLNVGENELMRNTTKLKKTVLELEKCSACEHLNVCQNEIQGYIYYPVVNNNKLDFSYIACKREKKFAHDNKYLNNVFSFDIPDMIKNAKMKDIYLDDKAKIEIVKLLKEFVINYKPKSKGMYLHGSFGCGKTFMISAAFNELAKKGVKSAIIYFPEYLRMLKTTFSTNFKENFEVIKEVDLLLIDDIGAENSTPWARDEILGPILQYRMEQNLTTFFTSNLSLEDLEIHLSTSSSGVDSLKARRIMERIKYLTVEKKLVSENKRKAA